MTENDTNLNPAAHSLRRRAEEKLRSDKFQKTGRLSPEETQQMLHELQVHKIELEMQNDELLRTQTELEASRERYFDLYELAPVGYVILSGQGLILEANLTATTLLNVERSALIKQPLTRFIMPEDQDIYYQLNKQLFRTSRRQVGELRLRQAQAALCWVQLEMTAAQDVNGALVCRAIMSDISARKRAEQLLLERAEAHSHEQATLLKISQTLASTLELQPGLILDQLREIVDYTKSGIFVLENSTLVALAMRGTPQLEQSSPIHIRLEGEDILTKLFNRYQPICIRDVWSADPQAQFLRWLLDDGAAVLLEGMHSWMWIPLTLKDRIIGFLGVAHEKQNFFTTHHANLALIVANKAAITMANAKLNLQAQEVAVLEERQHLARNLHDAVNQSLFSAGLIAEVLPRLWERDPEEARRSLEDLIRLTRGAQAEMRTLLAELRPAILTDSNLGDLLPLLGNAFTGRTTLPVTVTVTGDIVLPANVQIAFYRICQETLNNAAKHAKASQVEIYLNLTGAEIEMHIRDDGQGFDPEGTFSGHYGLSMMRERAEAAGARLSITSEPGHGTTVMLRWTPHLAEEA